MSSSSAGAASITWGTPQHITGASDVSTNGTLIGAFNVGATGVPSTTVNGVTFQSFATSNGNGSSGNFTTTGSGGVFETNTGKGSANPPFSSLPAAYQTLLQSASVPVFDPITLTISGLIAGLQYQFQWWANDSSTSFGQTTAMAGNSVTLEHNVQDVNGGLGQWVIGSFTADAATQTIAFEGDGDFGAFNAFQLRQISQPTGQVPEAGSTLALLACAFGGIALARRKLRL
ncbi:MAG TPA: VPDSG-CTERM sorting domain-containing protein [Chthoniobacterales bacterium]|nr:VPDSG-CTERM sorting domain-containing protein [Chthoniobacterales bacterium]